MEDSYANEGGSRWLEKEQNGQRRSKWVLWGAVALGAALIIGGIVAGIAISASKKHTSSGSGGGGGGGNSSKGGSDPSKFDKNPNLHNSFYGFAYTPLVRFRLHSVVANNSNSLFAGCHTTRLRC